MRLARLVLLMMSGLPVMLSGCAAALAPAVAGGLVARGQAGRVNGAPLLAVPSLAAAPAEQLPEPIAGKTPRLIRGAAELPAPVAAATEAGPAGPFAAFARQAIRRAPPPPPGEARVSALIDPASLLTLPRPEACALQPPAVAIDLDPGRGTFDTANPPLPAAGLADALASLRLAGLTVLWLSRLPEAEADRLATILKATALDPDGSDRLVLMRRAAERKGARLRQEARDWCIIAIAGDSRGDFEEAFDYLRDKQGVVAQALESQVGAGWFLTPLPID